MKVLNAIYEEDFLGFSCGFRPGRGQHDALDALAVGIDRCPVNWILDADIAGFFEFLERRIGDRRVIRLIRKWLKVGVTEDGEVRPGMVGTPQGAVISPLLATTLWCVSSIARMLCAYRAPCGIGWGGSASR